MDIKNEGETLRAHRLEAIVALRKEYAEHGDDACVAICDRAIAGDEKAYLEMLEVVTDTTYGGMTDTEHAAFLEECAKADLGDRPDRTYPNISERIVALGPAENIWPSKRHFS